MNDRILLFQYYVVYYVVAMFIIPNLPISKVSRIALVFAVLSVYILLVVKNGKI